MSGSKLHQDVSRTTRMMLVVLLGLFSLACGFNSQARLKSSSFVSAPPRQFAATNTQTSGSLTMLYNPNKSSNGNPLGTNSRIGRISRTQLYNIPEIEKWRILDGANAGCVQGFVKKHPTIPDGDIITTSPLKAPNAVGRSMIVTTSSGSKYKLLEPLEVGKKAGTVTLNRGGGFFGGGGTASRQSSSINVEGTNIPVLDDWKLLDNDSVQGFVFNHPTIPDGRMISTSTLKNPRGAKEKVTINTVSGSTYKLGVPEMSAVEAAAAAAADTAAAAAATSTKAPASAPASTGGGLFSFFNKAPSTAPAAKSKSSPAPAPARAAAAAAVVDSSPSKKELEKELKVKKAQATRDYGLTGERLGEDGQWLLAGQPIKSTSGKSLIFKAYKADSDGLPVGDVEGDAFVVKISSNDLTIEREASNFQRIAQSGITRGKFVELKEYLPADKMNSNSGRSKKQVGLVLERGAEDLKTYLARKREEGGLSGRELREAASAAAQCIQAIHNSGLVWTDMKTENFVVMPNGEFRGIDLESAIPAGGTPVDYSPEACPPEFATAFLAGEAPDFTLETNYDVWSFGMMCFEMANGYGYFDGKSPIQITRALSNMEEFDIGDVDGLDGRMKSLIETCLQVNPKKRPTVPQILLHPYFLTTGFGPFSF